MYKESLDGDFARFTQDGQYGFSDAPYFPLFVHSLILSPSGSGKTSALKAIENISYNSLHTERLTEARAEDELRGKPISLISWDVSRLFQNQDVIKVLEEALEEKKHLLNRKKKKV